jgi:hypothetical protein
MTFKLEGPLVRNIQTLDLRARGGMGLAAKYAATQAEAFMKNNASWTDRTGAARNGLRATTQITSDKIVIILYHSVPYGVFLETRWGGKYAIIQPGMQYAGKVFAETVGGMIFKSGAA